MQRMQYCAFERLAVKSLVETYCRRQLITTQFLLHYAVKIENDPATRVHQEITASPEACPLLVSSLAGPC